MLITFVFADDTKYCKWQYGYVRIAFIFICLITKLSAEISPKHMTLKLVTLSSSLILLFGWDALAAFLYISNNVETPNCIDLVTKIIDGSSIAVVLVIICIIFTYFFYTFFKLVRKNKKMKEFQELLEEIYEIIYCPEFDLDSFINEFQEIIDTTQLLDFEVSILKDRFGYDCDEDFGVSGPTDCVICEKDCCKGEEMCNFP